MKKIYMDACCFSRPFDDLRQPRILLEAEVILYVFEMSEVFGWSIVSSAMLDKEIFHVSTLKESMELYRTKASKNEYVEINETIVERARSFREHGIKPADSLHLALAEHADVNVFLTTDDKFLRKAQKLTAIRVESPVKWAMEENDDDQSAD